MAVVLYVAALGLLVVCYAAMVIAGRRGRGKGFPRSRGRKGGRG